MEYIAQFETCQQISPDDWKLFTPALKVTDDTTIGEIRKWMADAHRSATTAEFRVIALDQQPLKDNEQ